MLSGEWCGEGEVVVAVAGRCRWQKRVVVPCRGLCRQEVCYGSLLSSSEKPRCELPVIVRPRWSPPGRQ